MDDTDVPPKSPACGLVNLNATCYMNSLLQLFFFASPRLRQDIQQADTANTVYTNLHSVQCLEHVYDNAKFASIAKAFQSLLREMTSDKTLVDPSQFIAELGTDEKDFDVTIQQDANEVYTSLFDNLLQGLNLQWYFKKSISPCHEMRDDSDIEVVGQPRSHPNLDVYLPDDGSDQP
jgi:ubiquitin C-terminal hydrolase